MEGSTSYTATKNGFEVVLSKTDTELLIEAEDQGSGKSFSAKLANDAIKSMSQDIFENIPELFEGLATAFEGTSEDTIVNVDHKGKLLFTQKLKIGKHEKVFSFTIPLKVIEEDQMDRLEKQVKRMFRELEDVKKENQRLKEKLNMDYELISPVFNASDNFNALFSVSNDKKQITRNVTNNGSQYPLSSEIALSKEQNSKFQVKLDHLCGAVAIGMATRDAIKGQTCGSLPGSYCILTPNNINESSTNKNYSGYSSLSTGSIIGVLFMPNKGEIVFDINGTHIYTGKIDASYQKVDFYPFVLLSHNNSKASFI